MAERINKPINRIIERMRRKNKKFDKFMKQKEEKDVKQIQPRLPGMKKGKSVMIKPVGMIFKVEKKLAGGLLKTGIKAAVRSKPFQNIKKEAFEKTRKQYDKHRASGAVKKGDKKFVDALEKLDRQRYKAEKILDMTQYVLKQSRKAGRKDATRTMREARRAIVSYGATNAKRARALFDIRDKKIKLNNKGGIQNVANKLKKASKAHAAQAKTLEKIAKKSKGGMVDYYKDIL